ncbi:hypothetical protein TNCV_2080341 [Trichonephila clavipes]|nr:hypothetical protein TNCV_2080341 [Trichonephila clavipes]
MLRTENKGEQMNLKPTYVLTSFAFDPRAIEGHGNDLRTQSRAIARRVDHQNLLFPSFGIWLICFYGWRHSDRFFPYRGSERVSRHCSLPMKVHVSSTHFSNHFSSRRLLATNLVILNHGQVTRTAPELAPPLS